MAKLTLDDLASLSNQTSAISTINDNNAAIETALENTLSRDGTSPNQMGAALDMNSNRILNLPNPASALEPIRLQDIQDLELGDLTINSTTFNSSDFTGLTELTSVDPSADYALVYDSSATAFRRTLLENFGTVRSVLTYIPAAYHAAIADGTTTQDVTSYINTALTAASNGAWALYFPGGKYLVSNLTLPGLTPPQDSKAMIFGDGRGSRIVQKTATAIAGANNVLTVGSGTHNDTGDVYVFNLSIEAQSTKVGGAGIASTGSARLVLDHVYMMDGHMYNGIFLYGVDFTLLKRCIIHSVVNNAIEAYDDGTETGTTLTLDDDCYINAPGRTGVHIAGGLGGVYFRGIHIYGAVLGYGVHIDKANSGTKNREIFFDTASCDLDSNANGNLYVDTNSATVIRGTGAWFNAAGSSPSIYIKSQGSQSNPSDSGAFVSFIGCKMGQSGTGLTYEDDGTLQLIGNYINANDTGIVLSPGADARLLIAGNFINKSTQYAITATSAPASGIISGNDVSDSGTADFQNITDGSSNYHVYGNNGSSTSSYGGTLTRVSDTNVTLALGGSPTSALLHPVSITAGWSGQLGLSRGGTNADLSATGGTSQVLKQTSVGGNITVGQLAFSNISGAIAVSQLGNTSYAAGQIGFYISGVNFNSANTDNAIAITLPTGFTRYRVATCFISHASHDLTTARCGIFTQTGGGGTAVVVDQAITVSATAENTVNNMQSLPIATGTDRTFTFATLYFRISTAEGAAATGDVTLIISPVS